MAQILLEREMAAPLRQREEAEAKVMAQLNGSKAAEAKLLARVSELEREMAARLKQGEEAEAKVDAQLGDSKAAGAKLQARVSELEREMAVQGERLLSEATVLKAAQSSEDESRMLREKCAELEASVAEQSLAAQEAQATVEELQMRAERYGPEQLRALEVLAELKGQVSQLQGLLKESEMREGALQRKGKGLEQDVEQLQAALSHSTELEASLLAARDLGPKSGDIDELKERCAALEAEKAEMGASVQYTAAAAIAAAEAAQAETAALRDEAAQLRTALAAADGAAAAAQADRDARRRSHFEFGLQSRWQCQLLCSSLAEAEASGGLARELLERAREECRERAELASAATSHSEEVAGDLARLTRTAKDATAAASAAAAQVRAVSELLNSERASHSATITSKEASHQAISAELRTAEAEATQLRAETARLKAERGRELSTQADAAERHHRQLVDAEAVAELLRLQKDTQQQEVARLQRELVAQRAAAATREEVEAHRKLERRELEQRSAELAARQEAEAALLSELQMKRQRVAAVEDKLRRVSSQLQAEKAELEAELASVRTRYQVAEAALQGSRAAEAALRAQLDGMVGEDCSSCRQARLERRLLQQELQGTDLRAAASSLAAHSRMSPARPLQDETLKLRDEVETLRASLVGADEAKHQVTRAGRDQNRSRDTAALSDTPAHQHTSTPPHHHATTPPHRHATTLPHRPHRHAHHQTTMTKSSTPTHHRTATLAAGGERVGGTACAAAS